MNAANSREHILVAGHICLDIIPELERAIDLRPGTLAEIGGARLSAGGPVANTGLALHKLGVPVRLIAKVGDDLFGKAVRDIVEALGAGLTQGFVVSDDCATSYTIVVSPPGSDRMFLHSPGCNSTFAAADVSDAALHGAGIFHFGYPPLMANMCSRGGEELASLFQRAKETGALTSLDTAMPDPAADDKDWKSILSRTLPFVDIFTPSVEELMFMLRRSSYDALAAGSEPMTRAITRGVGQELAEECIQMGCGIVLLKAGDNGLYLRSAREVGCRAKEWNDRELWEPCFDVEVVGTTGSGDATVAGFLMSLWRGAGPEDALAAACAVGACCVEAADAVSGIRTWEETKLRMDRGWPKRPSIWRD